MASAVTAKPATALHGEPASNFEQLGSELSNQGTSSPAELQARRLCRLYAVPYATAATLARLAFDCGVPR
jgi:hypothetical protein